MADIVCPHCGQTFNIDDAELNSVIHQIRDREFKKEVSARVKEKETELVKNYNLEIESLREKVNAYATSAEDEKKIAVLEAVRERETAISKEHDMEIKALQKELDESKNKVQALTTQLSTVEDKKTIAVMEAVNKAEDEKKALQIELQQEKEKAKVLLDQKDELIEYYKDMKLRMSTKMIGETLEVHCQNQFDMTLRSVLPSTVEFDKDNDASSGSKGDYIYREFDESGNEVISIMFDMKNEADETATKKKNSDFFKELDKDRREKNCEYAVLVSLLEADSELYNSGIVDVSHAYPKMYVVRPQCFIPIITILRNAALNSLKYKQELMVVRNQHIDIANFEDNLMKFKDDFGRNYEIAHNHFNKAIDEIDKTIDHLQKVKESLLGSDKQLRIASGKVEKVTVEKLTKDNPTMRAKFEEMRNVSFENNE